MFSILVVKVNDFCFAASWTLRRVFVAVLHANVFRAVLMSTPWSRFSIIKRKCSICAHVKTTWPTVTAYLSGNFDAGGYVRVAGSCFSFMWGAPFRVGEIKKRSLTMRHQPPAAAFSGRSAGCPGLDGALRSITRSESV